MTDDVALIVNHPIVERAAAHLAKQAKVDIETAVEFLRNPSGWKTRTALDLVARLPQAQQVIADGEAGRLPAEWAKYQMRAARIIQHHARRFLNDLDPAEFEAICDHIDADAGEGPRPRELVEQLRTSSRGRR